MRRQRLSFLFAILIATPASTAELLGHFEPTGDMIRARSGHTATLLNDGRVLFAGGSGDRVAEIYDPSTRTFTRTGDMTAGRRGHSATLLADGRVLIAGGAPWSTSAEIYDPATERFAATGDVLEDQFKQAATLLPDGRVLIVGGERYAPPFPTAARPELYDPATGTFSFAALHGGAVWPTANVLPDGKILIIAGNPPALYDPATATFSFTGAMLETGYLYEVEWHAATSLRDGSVLLTGGNDDGTCGGFNYAELYDPSSGQFRIVGPMTTARDIHTATLLQDGKVLIAGGGEGWCSTPTISSTELYDPEKRSFTAAGHMTRSRREHTATLLNDGSVLIAGGTFYEPGGTLQSAELYVPAYAHTGRTRSRR